MIEEQKGTAEAEQLLEDLGFDELPVVPVEVAQAINCDDFKLVLEEQSFDAEGILGKAQGNSKGALVYINLNIPDVRRKNFTAAHEIGHVCMHIMPQRKYSFECGTKEITNPFDDPIEKEANGFASGLLLPERLIKQHCDMEVNWGNISKLSVLCDASLEATYRRMSYLENTPSALVIHKEGRFKRFVSSANFGFYIERSPLSSDQSDLSVNVLEEPFPFDFELVDASDWVNPRTKHFNLESVYSSTVSLKDGFSYTLLAYDDDCVLDEDF